MKYLSDSFSVFPGGNKAYRDNYDKIFGKKEDKSNVTDPNIIPSADEQKKSEDLPPPRNAQPAPTGTAEVKKKRNEKAKKPKEK